MSIVQAILASKKEAKSISPSVYRIQFGDLPILVIKSSICSAAISLQGAQLLFWQPSDQDQSVIWLSNSAQFQRGKAIRGGIPICWPWFANLGEPAHGFARTAMWQLDSVSENEDGVDLLLSLTNSLETDPFFTEKFTLTLALHLGESCKLTLTSEGDFDATSALHTYFDVDNIDDVVVSGLSDDYFDKVDKENRPKIKGEMQFDQEVDRIYANVENPITINDKKRVIQVTNENATDIIVWNPWGDKSISMKDMDDDGYRSMVCVETGRINRPLKLAPSVKTSYGVNITVIKSS
ncbi:D-hexose-6-phosphate mutarotase [Orbaceae bacterium ESL0721]|nr:D-hexose-6-phosphate mutarotase [Orbaceae bacterium ESL0721]